MKNKLLFAAMLAVLAAKAQVRLTAVDPSIHYELVRPEHSIYQTTWFDSAGKISRQLVIDHVTRIDSARKEIDFISSVQYAPGKLLIDSSIDNYSGSARYILATYPSAKHEYIRFLPGSAEAHNVIGGVAKDKITPMSSGYFDDNSLWDILGFITFKKNIKYQLDCYGTDTGSQVSIPFEIEYLFDDSDPGPGGTVVKSMVLKVSHPGSVAYVWINKETRLTTKVSGQGENYNYTRRIL